DVLQNTSFNKIIPDLWPIIKEYFRTFSKFVIGSYDIEYPGYRMIEENDFNNKILFDELVTFYRTNKGFQSVDDFCGNVLFCRDKLLTLNDRFLRLNLSEFKTIPIAKGSIIFFFTTYYYCRDEAVEHVFENFEKIKTQNLKHLILEPTMGLFVKKD